jgi:hypothetical protein
MTELAAAIRTAIGATTAQRTARLAMHAMIGTTLPSAPDLQGEGVADFQRRRAHLRWQMMTTRMLEQSSDKPLLHGIKSAFGAPREAIFNGGRGYLRLDDGTWWSNEADTSGPRNAGDPTWPLDAFRGVTEVASAVGTEDVRDVRTRRVRCILDLRQADLAARPAGITLPDKVRRRWPWRRGQEGWETRIPAEIWLDGAGLVRRLSIAPVPHLAKREGDELWSSVEFWDFGVACEIEIPADAVTELPARCPVRAAAGRA